jgi:xanthine dehydrogenase small subunit
VSALHRPLQFLLNGQSVVIDNAAAQTTLLDILRDRGLTGAKEGCAEGECGACMVLDVTRHNDGGDSSETRGTTEPGVAARVEFPDLARATPALCRYRAINSCLMFAPMAAGREIYTVEALAENGELAEAQQAMAAAGGSQCGYCTPGFVVSLFAEQYRPGRSGPCDPQALAGNLCRCTGYRPIADAARSLGPAPAGRFRDRLARPAPQVESFAYQADGARFERPTTLDECLSIAAADPQVQWIAGATDLGVESNLRFRRWSRLVSLEAVPELLEFSESPHAIRIGAGLPIAEIELRWRSAPDIFRQWLPLFASPPLRNRATLGGNLATASPIGDGAPMLLALDASVVLASARGRRTVSLSAFFPAYRQSALKPGELILAIEIPKPLPSFTRFYKVAKRRVDDISTLAAGFSADLDHQGRVIRARFAFGGAAATPLRAYAAEEAILGERWSKTSIKRVQSALETVLSPMGDHRGSAEYRREAAKSLIEKFCWEYEAAA